MFLVLGLEILTQGKPPSIRTRREDHKVPWFLKVGLNVRVRWGGGMMNWAIYLKGAT